MENDCIVLKNALLDGIKNGVLEDGEVRDFDVLDYYNLTKIKLEDVIDYLVKMVDFSHEDIIFARTFINKCSMPVGHIVIEEKYISRALHDKDIICGIEITNEVKQEAFDYLKSNGIPINHKTYMTCLRRSVLEMKKQLVFTAMQINKR